MIWWDILATVLLALCWVLHSIDTGIRCDRNDYRTDANWAFWIWVLLTFAAAAACWRIWA